MHLPIPDFLKALQNQQCFLYCATSAEVVEQVQRNDRSSGDGLYCDTIDLTSWQQVKDSWLGAQWLAVLLETQEKKERDSETGNS